MNPMLRSINTSTRRALRRSMLRTEGKNFCNLFNAQQSFLGHVARIGFDAPSRMYFAEDSRNRIYFCQKNRAWLYINGIWDRAAHLGKTYLLNKIDLRAGDIFVDCGANIGELFFYVQETQPESRYIGFEPSPVEFQTLAKNVTKGEVHNVGLWNEEDQLELYLSSERADSSLIQPRFYDSVVKVQTKRLDSMVTGRIKVLKIEAEGAEPEVLLGCANLLEDVEYVCADVGFERGKECGSTLAPVVNYLINRDFELVDMSHERIVCLFRNRSLVE